MRCLQCAGQWIAMFWTLPTPGMERSLINILAILGGHPTPPGNWSTVSTSLASSPVQDWLRQPRKFATTTVQFATKNALLQLFSEKTVDNAKKVCSTYNESLVAGRTTMVKLWIHTELHNRSLCRDQMDVVKPRPVGHVCCKKMNSDKNFFVGDFRWCSHNGLLINQSPIKPYC